MGISSLLRASLPVVPSVHPMVSRGVLGRSALLAQLSSPSMAREMLMTCPQLAWRLVAAEEGLSPSVLHMTPPSKGILWRCPDPFLQCLTASQEHQIWAQIRRQR